MAVRGPRRHRRAFVQLMAGIFRVRPRGRTEDSSPSVATVWLDQNSEPKQNRKETSKLHTGIRGTERNPICSRELSILSQICYRNLNVPNGMNLSHKVLS